MGAARSSICRLVSFIEGLPNRYAYGATTKAAVIGLAKAVTTNFITKGIRCNAICPGTIVSPSFEERVKAVSQTTGESVEQIDNFIARQPIAQLLRHRRGSRPRSRFSWRRISRATSPASRTLYDGGLAFSATPLQLAGLSTHSGLLFGRRKPDDLPYAVPRPWTTLLKAADNKEETKKRRRAGAMAREE